MDISSLRERSAPAAMTVGALNTFIKSLFETNRVLSAVTVTGEISNFNCHSSGHLYFSLKDSDSQIKAIMFRSNASTLKFFPENGMRVTVRGTVGVYLRGGTYQLYVSSMQPDGIGALYVAFEQLKKRLEAEGLFSASAKRALPKMPLSIGVITSPTGAAVRDIINVCGRRFPLAELLIFPSLVQGAEAEGALIRALDYFEESSRVDVIIIGRGGGSIEDLWAFNGEALAKKIFSMHIPVISAVGHETDFTICDFVADMRAPTPSSAAELAVPDAEELMQSLEHYALRLKSALKRVVERRSESLGGARERLALAACRFFEMKRNQLNESEKALVGFMDRALGDRRSLLGLRAEKLNALSPLGVLSRGYAIAELNGRVLTSVAAIKPSDRIKLRLSDGCAEAVIDKIGDGISNE